MLLYLFIYLFLYFHNIVSNFLSSLARSLPQRGQHSWTSARWSSRDLFSYFPHRRHLWRNRLRGAADIRHWAQSFAHWRWTRVYTTTRAFSFARFAASRERYRSGAWLASFLRKLWELTWWMSAGEEWIFRQTNGHIPTVWVVDA